MPKRESIDLVLLVQNQVPIKSIQLSGARNTDSFREKLTIFATVDGFGGVGCESKFFGRNVVATCTASRLEQRIVSEIRNSIKIDVCVFRNYALRSSLT